MWDSAGPAEAGVVAVGIMDDLLARQVVRQWPALRLQPPRPGRWNAGLLGGGFALRLAGLQLLKLQFELLDCPVETFGGTAELHATQPGELHLQLLDLQSAQLNGRHGRRELGLTGQGESPQRFGIGRQIGGGQ